MAQPVTAVLAAMAVPQGPVEAQAARPALRAAAAWPELVVSAAVVAVASPELVVSAAVVAVASPELVVSVAVESEGSAGVTSAR